MHAAGSDDSRWSRAPARDWPHTSPFPRTSRRTRHSQQLPYEIPRGRLSEIDLAITRCEQGSGALVWTGEPGMGKSALLAHAAAAAEGLGSLVIRVPSHRSNGDGKIALDCVVRQLVDATKDPDARGMPASPLVTSNLREAATHQNAATLGRSLADLIAAGNHQRAVVFVIDDLENLDETTKRTLIGAIAERRAAAVLLVTATDADLVRSLPYEVERRPLAPITNADALFMLQESLDTAIAPHVIHVLNEHVSGAPTALVETAQTLSSAQLAGLSQLPDPLPVSPSTHRAVSQQLIGMPARDREILLTAAVAVSDRTDLFLAATGMDIDELLASSAARHLRLVTGHIMISDPRIRAVVHGDASVGERTAVHQRLARAHAAAGSDVTSVWHHALAASTGDAALSDRLLEVATRMLELGDAAWAQRVAREGLSHATGVARAHAMIVAGTAALHAGHISDAVGLLREASRILPDDEARQVSAALTAAIALSTGQVPEEILQSGGHDIHTQQLAAVFHTERGEFDAAFTLLEAMDPADSDVETARVELLRAWVRTLTGRPDSGLDLPTLPLSDPIFNVAARIVRALSLVGTGAVNEARRVLTAAISELSPATTSPWEPEFHDGDSRGNSITPLLEAYLHLADIIIEYATGNMSGAHKSLQQAVFTLPMALPFGGLICVIAGRLSVLRTGEVDELATVLEKLVPIPFAPSVRAELFANRATAHLIAGETREAETLMKMTRNTKFGVLPLILRPNFVDISKLLALPAPPAHEMMVFNLDSLAPQDAVKADVDVDALEMALRHLIAGRRAAANAAATSAAESFMRAAMLFDEVGAIAVSGLAQGWAEELTRNAPATTPGTQEPNAEAAAQAAIVLDDLRVRILPRWATTLTDREREVAQIIASGATNREAAAALFVSVRTIEVHLTSIFRKLEIGSRVELAIVVSHAPLS